MKHLIFATALTLMAGNANADLVVNYFGANVTRTYIGPVTWYDENFEPEAALSMPAAGPSTLSNNDVIFHGAFDERHWAWLALTPAPGLELRHGFCSSNRNGEDVVLICQ
jgi:hypothetical protein